MQEKIVDILLNYEAYAVIISLFLNIVISIFGVLPSVFMTAANLLVFGVWKGTLISFIGEAMGAIVAFWLYRKGFKRFIDKKKHKHSLIDKLLSAKGKEAFMMILLLRLFPFIPSGVVTFTAAMGEVSFINFLFASSLGKVPSLLIEAYSVHNVAAGTMEGKIILTVVSVVGILYIWAKLVRKKNT
ncbi:TVP38/TMEM64 family protein [Fredinandcohnia salidurans]|uniref:TVP38/TMEM64 family membrane protein n=1 Tax=Fredinandcohnia salidurans TaxID=2595041 RepID=A0ABW4MNJ5_9BACI|nr:VTT domain-containing protein [Fredinandcohnia onubensis]